MIEMKKSERYFLTNEEPLITYNKLLLITFWTEKNSNSVITNQFCQKLKIVAENKEYEISVANKNIRQINNITNKIFDTLNLQELK